MTQRILLPCLCALSLVLNVWLWLRAHHNEQRLRLDPLELDHYAPIRPPPPAPPGVRRVVLYGDSRARSWPEPESIPGVAFENRGIGYQTTAQVLGRFALDVAPLAPAVVVLQVGVNDLTVPAEGAHRRHILERCKANIAELVQSCLDVRAHVLLLPIFPVGPTPWYRRPWVAKELGGDIVEVNRFLSTLASPNVEVLDMGPLLNDPAGLLRQEYRRDFLHLNDAGYRALDGAMHRHLLALLPRLASGLSGAARADDAATTQ